MEPEGVSERQVLMALELLAACIPQAHVTPGPFMASVWHGRLNRYPAEAMFAVAREWNGDKFPSVGQFAAAVRGLVAPPIEEAPWL